MTVNGKTPTDLIFAWGSYTKYCIILTKTIVFTTINKNEAWGLLELKKIGKHVQTWCFQPEVEVPNAMRKWTVVFQLDQDQNISAISFTHSLPHKNPQKTQIYTKIKNPQPCSFETSHSINKIGCYPLNYLRLPPHLFYSELGKACPCLCWKANVIIGNVKGNVSTTD